MKDYKKEAKILEIKFKAYKKAYEELNCYFDSISDEEQDEVWKRLQRIFKNMNKQIEKNEVTN